MPPTSILSTVGWDKLALERRPTMCDVVWRAMVGLRLKAGWSHPTWLCHYYSLPAITEMTA